MTAPDDEVCLDDAVRIVAELMAISARTAPKTMGTDIIEIKIIKGKCKDKLAAEMRRLDREGRHNYERDSKGVEASPAVLLIGLKSHSGVGLNCGACGFDSCAGFDGASTSADFKGPNCMLRLLDLGIALGSAAKTASMHNVDNRLMIRIGVAARSVGLTKTNVCCGIPLTATGKSPFFDR